jgi:hypothetical protein
MARRGLKAKLEVPPSAHSEPLGTPNAKLQPISVEVSDAP